MKTVVEYNSKLALGDKIIFCLDGKKFTGKVSKSSGYWIDFSEDDNNHAEIVDKIFTHFNIPDRYSFRNMVTGHDWNGYMNGIWPYTSSLEELKKMLDEL